MIGELKDKISKLEKQFALLHEKRSSLDVEIARVSHLLEELRVQAATEEERQSEYCAQPGAGQFNPANVYLIEELPAHRKVVTRASTLMDKYALFVSLFEGRPDVHALRYQSRDGSAGYTPHCLNRFKPPCPKQHNKKHKCKDCERQDFPSITPNLFVAHAHGKSEKCKDVLGAYPLDGDGLCTFIVADFDDEHRHGEDGADDEQVVSFDSMQATTLAFYKTCIASEIPVHLEISRSGHGMHVWLFFSECVSAHLARRLFSLALTEAMERFSDFNMSTYDRFIPHQDILPKGGFGNLIALPLQGRAASENRSIFVDDELRAFSDQMEYLSRVKKFSACELERALGRFATFSELGTLVPNEAEEKLGKPWERKKSEVLLSSNDFNGLVRITYANMLHIEKCNLSPRALNRLRRLAAFKNPKFYENQQMRLPTWNIPRIISTADETADYLSLPRGAREEVEGLFDLAGAEYAFDDLTNSGSPLDVEFSGLLRDSQPDAAAALLKCDIGVLCATTAYGKTVVGAYLIAQRKVNTLILVHTQQLLEQWKEALAQFLRIGNEPATRLTPKGRVRTIGVVGEYSGNRKHRSLIVDVAMMQSLHRDHEVQDFVKDYGMVIVDECHHVPASSFEAVLKTVSARYVYGLTATPMREDGHHAILFLECGPIRYRVNAKAQAEKRPFEHYMIPRFTSLHTTALHDEKNALTIWSDLVADQQRNEMIIGDIVAAVQEGRHPLVLSERTEHVRMIADALTNECANVMVLIGADTRKAKREVLERLGNLKDDESFVIVATGKYVGEGFDFPRLDTLFLTLPFKARRMVTQYIGRLHRLSGGKKDVQVYDYVDINIPSLERQYLQRIKGYKEAGYKILNKTDNAETTTFVFDHVQFWETLAQDCREATQQIVFSSPSLSAKRVTAAIPALGDAMMGGLTLTVITKPSVRPMALAQIQRLRDLGAKVVEMEGVRQRFAIIDQRVVWFGSINPLGFNSHEDSIIRIKDAVLADALLDHIR
jgi:superfamily II DNA or RNA helicase